MAARTAVVLAALALLAREAPAARSRDDAIPSLADAHVFLDSDSQRSFDASGCALPCGWMATDAHGNFVAEGTIAADRAVHLQPADFPVGFYRIAFSRPGTNATTAADPTIEAGRVGKMAVGLNLAKSGAAAQMTVCDLEWICF